MAPDRRLVVLELAARRELAVDQEEADLHEIRLLGQDLDRNPTVVEDALFAVDEGDGALAGAGVRVARVEGDVARLRPELRDVDGALALAPDDDRELPRLVPDAQLGLFLGQLCLLYTSPS